MNEFLTFGILFLGAAVVLYQIVVTRFTIARVEEKLNRVLALSDNSVDAD